MRDAHQPAHLGGHNHTTWVDKGALAFLVNHFNVSSMVDVGCGPGGMKKIAKSLNVEWFGIDGDPSVKQNDMLIHDFTKGAVDELATFDLGWSVEFLEHVHEEYQPNYMNVFSKCKFILCTAALPGWRGHHHVNEQHRDYWITTFSNYGFAYDQNITDQVINHSTMIKKKKIAGYKKSFMQITGMFFINDC